MFRTYLIIIGLLLACFSMAARLDSSLATSSTTPRNNALNVLMGDSRRLFAAHVFSKADAYFHTGYYPSIFDQVKENAGESHIEEASREDQRDEPEAEGEGHVHDENCGHHEEESDFLGKPKNWIDAFGRNFYPSKHMHIEEADEREVLPWLKLAADLDPQKIETYLVGSYTLRKRLGKVAEAEQFLRDGLRVNPDSYDILIELGKIQNEHYHEAARARNLWELALRKWQQQQHAGRKPDEFALAQLLGQLSTLEEAEGNYTKAVEYLTFLKQISPSKGTLEERISELRAKIASP
jgi:tetratricopeptide (TPR) repeat protein